MGAALVKNSTPRAGEPPCLKTILGGSVIWMMDTAIGPVIALALVALYLLTCIRVLNEYERGVIFRLGRAMPKPKGPGLIMVFWPVDSMMRVDLRTITKVIEPQDIITRDNVSVRVNAVLYFRVVDPMRSVLEVADFLFATSQVALTTLRSTLGQAELDDLLTERDKVNRRLQEIIDGHTEPWGVKVSVVEVKDVDLPEPMKRSMARQAEAERERRAKVINAEGEFQAANKLREAAEIMTPYPMAMQMRYLQALADVASDQNSTIIFPLPLELLRPFLGTGRDGAGAMASGRPENASPELKGLKDPAQCEKIVGTGAIPATVGGNGR
jgi:regulator of protease activity HflC (stomatin/prohibitin superfamily)